MINCICQMHWIRWVTWEIFPRKPNTYINKLPAASHNLFVELLKSNWYHALMPVDYPSEFTAGITAIFITDLFNGRFSWNNRTRTLLMVQKTNGYFYRMFFTRNHYWKTTISATLIEVYEEPHTSDKRSLLIESNSRLCRYRCFPVMVPLAELTPDEYQWKTGVWLPSLSCICAQFDFKYIWVFPKWLSLSSLNSVNLEKKQKGYGYQRYTISNNRYIPISSSKNSISPTTSG